MDAKQQDAEGAKTANAAASATRPAGSVKHGTILEGKSMRRSTAIRLCLVALAIIVGIGSTYQLLRSPFRLRYRLANIQPSNEVPFPYFSPDGRTLVVCAKEQNGTISIRLVDLATGRTRMTFISNFGKIDEVAVSNDGRYLCVRDGVTDYQLWDTAEGAERALLHEKDLSSRFDRYMLAPCRIMFSQDSKFLAVAVADAHAPAAAGRRVQRVFKPHVRILATATASEVKISDEPIYAVGFAPDAQSIAYTTWDQASHTTRLGIWDVKAGRQSTQTVAHHSPTTRIAFSPDGAMLASSGEGAAVNCEVKLWDVPSLKERAVLMTESEDDFRFFKKQHGLSLPGLDGLYFSPDGRLLVTMTYSATMIWNVRAQPPQKELQLRTTVLPIFTRDASLVAAPRWGEGIVEIRDCDRFQRLATIRLPAIPLHPDFQTYSLVPSLNALPACNLVAISGTEAETPKTGGLTEWIAQRLHLSDPQQTITRLWNVSTGQELGHLSGEGLSSPDGCTLVTLSQPGDIKVWSLQLTTFGPDKCILGIGLSASILFSISASWCVKRARSAIRNVTK